MPAASEIMDLETKPHVSGNAEIDRAPTMPQAAVIRHGPEQAAEVGALALARHVEH